MELTANDRHAPAGHEGLLRSLDDPARAGLTVDSWYRSATARRYTMCTVCTSPPRGAAGVVALAPADLHPSSAPAGLVHQLLREGDGGVGILIEADNVIAETSDDYHDSIETALTELCAAHPVSVLCVYDRPGAGTECLDLAVGHHRDVLHEQQLAVRTSDDSIRLAGEVDVTNLDVVEAALENVVAARPEQLCIDLTGTAFLSAAAAHRIQRHLHALHRGGTGVELRGVAPNVGRVLRLAERHLRSTG